MAAGGIRAGRAYVELGVQDDLTRGLARARAQLEAFGTALRAIGWKALASGGAVAAGLGAAVRSFAGEERLEKLAAQTGIAVDSLSALRHAASLSGTELETLTGAVARMQRNLVGLAAGDAQASAAFRRLGLQLEDLGRLRPEDQLAAIAQRLAALRNPAERAAAAMEIFGRGGAALLPLLTAGRGGFGAMLADARRLGLIVTPEQAAAAAALEDSLYRVRAAAQAVLRTIGEALAPAVTRAAEAVAGNLAALRQWIAAHRGVVFAAAAAAGAALAFGSAALAAGLAIGAALRAVSAARGALLGLAAVTKTVALIVAGLANPIVLVTAAIAALAAVAVVRTNAMARAWAAAGNYFKVMGSWLRDLFGSIAAAVSAGNFTAAARVAMAGLRVAFLEGAAGIRGVWAELTGWMRERWLDATTGMLAAWNDLRHGIATMSADMQASAAGVVQSVAAAAKIAGGWLSEKYLKGLAAAGMLGKGVTPEAFTGLSAAMSTRALADLYRANAEAEAARKKSLDAEQARYAEEQRRIVERDKASQDAARARQDAGEQAARDALERARKELEDARAEARQPPKQPALGPQPEVPALAEAFQQRIQAVGLFNASRVLGLQGAGVQDRIAEATASSAKTLREIARLVQRNVARFA